MTQGSWPRWLLLLFLITIPLNWPGLPLNIRAADLLFIPAAATIFAAVGTWRRPRPHALDTAVVIYLAGSLAAMLFSPDPGAGTIELVRHLYVATIYVVIALAAAHGFVHTVSTGLAASGGGLAVIGVAAAAFQALTGQGIAQLTPVMPLPYVGDALRLRVLTASPAMFACVLAVAAPFALCHPAIRRSRGLTMSAAIILAIAAAGTLSHAIAGVAVAALVLAWRPLSIGARRHAAAAATIAIVLAFNFAATVAIRSIGVTRPRDEPLFQYGVADGRTAIAGIDIEYQTMSYWRIKQVAYDAFLSRPMFGIGLDRFHDTTEAAFRQGRLTANYRAIDPHCTFVGRLAETGLIGLVTLVILWIAIGRAAIEWLSLPSGPDWMALAAAAALAGTLVNSMNADVMNFRFLWVVLGLMRGRLAAQS
jgi:hypothetical protein